MTKDEQGYNGWPDRETWLVALWIDNEQGSYNHARALARQALEEAKDSERQAGILADKLEQWVAETGRYHLPTASLFSDLVSAALGRVDWHEIAKGFIEDVEAP